MIVIYSNDLVKNLVAVISKLLDDTRVGAVGKVATFYNRMQIIGENGQGNGNWSVSPTGGA